MWVKLRTTPEQRAAWYAKAEAKGVNFSELARQALDGITVRRRAQLRRIDPALLRQLARLGNNLNQLARWANRDQRQANSFAITAQLVSIERELAKLRKAYEVRDAD
ncbi:MAG: MobC family plasmid mobilization relaxosome protein [Rhodobacteraceae bacterium]|nr:MobC family plasmid mobilization relaxosome protein [Paracoccaceae bacterium]